MDKLVSTFREHSLKKIDDKILRELFNFKSNWIKKSEHHMLFLGGNLFGPNPIVFSDNDRRIYFDIIGIDDDKELKIDIDKVDGIFPEREVSSDEFNLSIVWLCYEYSILFKNNEQKYRDAVDLIYFIFAVKVYGSRYAKWFNKYPLDNDTAKAVFEKLTDKFLIKSLGNWQSVIKHSGEKLYSTDQSGFDSRIKNLNAENAIYVVADIHGTINSLIKNIYNITKEVKASGDRIRSTSAFDTSGDEISLKDKIDTPLKYITYMKDIVGSEDSFIDFSITDIVIHLFPKIKDKTLKQILQVVSHSVFMSPDINKYFIEKPIILSMEYLGANKHLDYLDNIEKMLLSLKNYWSSSRIKEKEAIETKDKIRDFLKNNTTYTTNHILSNIVLAIIIYVFLKSIKYR